MRIIGKAQPPHHFLPIKISEPEYRVLCCVGLEGGFIKPDGIAALAAAIWRPKELPAADYADAVAACLEQGWIKVITEENKRADTERWANVPHQSLSETPYREGFLDFTPEGWDSFTRLTQQKHGGSHEAHYAECVQYLWDVPGQVSLLCMSQDTLRHELDAIITGEDGLTSSDTGSGLRAQHTLGEINGPYPIGTWWFNRFYQAPIGFRLDVSFEPADLHADDIG